MQGQQKASMKCGCCAHSGRARFQEMGSFAKLKGSTERAEAWDRVFVQHVRRCSTRFCEVRRVGRHIGDHRG